MWDKWRENYSTIDQTAFHNAVFSDHPEQAHYNRAAFLSALEKVRIFPHVILEAGAWRADLAQDILSQEKRINAWYAAEICTAAIQNTRCTDARFRYMELDGNFTWWQHVDFSQYGLFFGTHFLEHLSDEHATDLLSHARNCNALYFEAPIERERRRDWSGYPGSHMLLMGWDEIRALLPEFDAEFIAPYCVLLQKRYA